MSDDRSEAPLSVGVDSHQETGVEPGQENRAADVSDAADGPADAFQRLSPNFVSFERWTGYIVASVLLIVVIPATSPLLWLGGYFWVPWLVIAGWCALAAILLMGAHIWPAIVYRNIVWRLGTTGIEIHRGVLWQHRLAIPLSRVQHVDVAQGPIQRMFDLGTITIHTAGTKNASVELSGLEHAEAMGIRDELIAQRESRDVL